MERDEFCRAAWQVMLAEKAEKPGESVLFVEEMGANTSLCSL